MECTFQTEAQFMDWLDDILHTNSADTRFDAFQCLPGIQGMAGLAPAIPLPSVMHRTQAARELFHALKPVLPFLQAETLSGHVASELVKNDVEWYQRNDLLTDLSDCDILLVFIDCSGREVILSILSVRNEHRLSLDLSHLVKTMVCSYLLDQPEPITYRVTGNQYTISVPGKGDIVQRTVAAGQEEEVYLRLYASYREVQQHRKEQDYERLIS